MFAMDFEVRHMKAGTLNIEVHPTSEAAGKAAAQAAAQELSCLDRAKDTIGVIFATGASQLDMLQALTSLPHLPWGKISGFHLDEYIGVPSSNPASFRYYLRKNLTQNVPMKEFFEIDGTASHPERVCQEYAARLSAADPQLCLLGIGENGHLAFNDPDEADFNDPLDMKIVHLDAACRMQQAAEGWFDRFGDVPEKAMTITIPALMRVPRLLLSVPGSRKAEIVRRTLTEVISPVCPATLLRTHPNATLYLDLDSAANLDGSIGFS
jgi:glucosamine-6-phosphate deaminase